MKTVFKRIGIVLGIFVLWLGYWVTDNFIYPIKAVSPNYSDVESAFAKLQFPADWQEISSSENRGLHGRDCDPLNNSGCFHRGKKFKVPQDTTQEDIKKMLSATGCSNVLVEDITLKEDKQSSFSFSCSAGGGVSVAADLIAPDSTAYVSVRTY